MLRSGVAPFVRWSAPPAVAAGILVAVLGARSSAAAPPRAAPPVDATLELTAACEAGSTEPSALDIALSLPLRGRPVFRLDDEVFGSRGMAALVSSATAVDARGPLALTRRLTAGPTLELAAAREVTGTVTLRYRARSVPVADDGARFGLRHDATGIGGVGGYFLALPESPGDYRVRVTWAPPACPAGTGGEGASTFGGATAETTGGLDELRAAAYFFGHPRVAAADDGDARVRTAWFGEPALDTAAAARWAARVFAAERAVFADDDPGAYSVFVRVLPELGARSNGVGQPRSLVLAIGPAIGFGPRLRTNLAHEMLHRWLGHTLRLAGSSFWLTEGFTVHYAAVVMQRAGLSTPDELLAELNVTATRQFANEYAGASNDEIRRGFFASDALSLVPYTRGALYAAELDGAIRRASHGLRSLDDALRALVREARAAPGRDGLPPEAFRRMVVRELGAAGARRFDAVIERGARPEPPDDAFGPCFTRRPRTVAVYQLGFDDRRSLVAPRAIRGLVAGSAAARAGLVEGDRLLALEPSFLDPDHEAAVTVERAGQPVVVRYLPARPGPRRDGFEWVRVAGVPDARCVPPG